MRKLENVSCSLNLGLIYSLDYSYSPEDGINITIFFVNQTGDYQELKMLPMQKATIKIGNTTFSLYPKSYKISKADGRKVMSVDFVDETFMLQNYFVVLRGRGCGKNIFEIGAVVDQRTDEQKRADSLDPTAQRVKEFSQFYDLEYTFDDFLLILRKKFSVAVDTDFDFRIKKDYVGTFRDVLDSWCTFYNLAYYFENSQIKIYDPTKLTVVLPKQQAVPDAISYEFSEDIDSTFGKTVSRYYQEEGGEAQFRNGLIETATLFPIGYEFNLDQNIPDLKQVAAAMYGQNFWFLYNLYNDTLFECGWTYAGAYGGYYVAEVDEEKFNEKFQAYAQYGKSIAGRWYLSNRMDSLDIAAETTWFSEADGQIFIFDSELGQQRKIQPILLESPTLDTAVIDKTYINQYFQGIKYTGKRMAFVDEQGPTGFDAAFILSDEIEKQLDVTTKEVFPDGAASLSLTGWTGLQAGKNYRVYKNLSIAQTLTNIFTQIKDGQKDIYLKPRYASYPMKGSRKKDEINKEDTEDAADDLRPKSNGTKFETNQARQNFATTRANRQETNNNKINQGLVRVKKDGTYTVYYDKVSKCASRATEGDYYMHKFDIERVSNDNAIKFKFLGEDTKYTFERDYSFIDAILEDKGLDSLAEARTFTRKTVTFTTNYYYAIPLNFLSNGLIGIQMSFDGNGLSCTYTFSNSVMEPPRRKRDEQNWIKNFLPNFLYRKYNVKDVITERSVNMDVRARR